jgi:hypothetical protein
VLTVKRKGIELSQGVIGLVSDTHGLVRPQALAALRGSELIIHAGDIGKPEVLAAFGALAPVLAVRGNNDREPWAKRLPDILDLRVNGVKIYVIHDVHDLPFDPGEQGFRAVISGHSHKPSVIDRGGVLFINPGSAGSRRFTLPIAVGKLRNQAGKPEAKIIEMEG